MPSKSSNLKLNKFYESDVFDINLINENFEILDSCLHIIKKEQQNTNTDVGATTWDCYTYSDKTVVLKTAINLDSMSIKLPSGTMYNSESFNIALPGLLSKIKYVTLNYRGQTNAYPVEVGDRATLNSIKIKMVNNTQVESSSGSGLTIIIEGVGI